ncbi:MAG: hypothetical protein Q9221_003342 [Calogaya cf. arnoldii]
MALVGNAPKIFTRCTKSGIPYYAMGASASWSLLAYLNCADSGATVFNWFINLINTGGYQSWICVCIIYLRFRRATFAQNITDLPFRSKLQPYLAYICIAVFTTLILLSGYKVFLPGYWKAANFLTGYIGIPIFLILYFGHRWTVGKEDAWWHGVEEMDLVSGLAEVVAQEEPRTISDEKWYVKWRTALT